GCRHPAGARGLGAGGQVGQTGKGSKMNTSERVIYFLRSHQGIALCDDCVRAELRLSQPISRMLDVLSKIHFQREVALCSMCRQNKLTILMRVGTILPVRRQSKPH